MSIKNKWQLLKCKYFRQPPLSMHHKPLKTIKILSDNSYLIECETCGKKFAMNHSVKVVLPFDKELIDMYELMDTIS